MKRIMMSAALAAALCTGCVGVASAQVGQYLGEVRNVGFNFCPTGWAAASGQLLPINQNQALFSLLGTYYGGNGIQNFALPNLNGRTPYGSGTPGGQPLGAVYGNSTVTLTLANLPAHSHMFNASTANPATPNPAGGLTATFPQSGDQVFAPSGSPANVPMAATIVGFTGQNLPFSVQSPALSMNWCIALTGIYPTRN